MATTYLGSKMQAGVQPRTLHQGYDTVQISTYTQPGVAFVLNDIVQFVQLESDASITNNGPVISTIVLDVPALDSSTGIVLAVGDSGSAGRFISGATIGRSGAGGIQGLNVAGSIGYAPFASSFSTYTTPSLATYIIQMKVTTAATGTATTTGTLALKVAYTVDP